VESLQAVPVLDSAPGPAPAESMGGASTQVRASERARQAAPSEAPAGGAHAVSAELRARAAQPHVVEARGSSAREQNEARRVSGEAPRDRQEVLELAEAEQLLTSDPEAALTLVRAGNARYKQGYLRHERRYIEVMALFALGRRGEARAHALWFLNQYKASPYRANVERAVEQSAAE
jgi:hypothetical protein